MQQDMTNSFLKGIFNFRERERLLKFILPQKMKLDWEEHPVSLSGAGPYHDAWLMKYFDFPGSQKISLVKSFPQIFNLCVHQNMAERGICQYKIESMIARYLSTEVRQPGLES